MEFNNKSLFCKYKNLPILIKIFFFQEELNQTINLSTKPKAFTAVFIQKNVMKELKDIFNYKKIYSVFKEVNIIEHIKENDIIKNENINDFVILNIIYLLENVKKDLVEEIENINLEEKKNTLKIKNKKNEKEWNYKHIIYNKDNGKMEKINYIDDFEIITLDIFMLLQEQNIQLKQILGHYIVDNKKLYIFIGGYNYNFLEIGHFDNNGIFNIEYLLNSDEINDSSILRKYFENYGINKAIQKFDKQKEINFIYYDKYKISCYKFNEDKYSDKLKALILLSICQNKICNNNNHEEKVFLLNKDFLENFKFSHINGIIIKNEKIKKYIDGINIQNMSLDLNYEIISELDNNELKQIDKIISGVKHNVNHKPEKEEIILFDSKKIKIFKEFILINQKIFNDFISHIFKIKIKNQNFSFISVNNKDILKINYNNQYEIFIGKYNPQEFVYNIELILDFENIHYLNDEFNNLIKMNFDNYYNKRLIFSNNNASPIFSNNIIIGYSYIYNDSIKNYSSLNKYIKYSKDKNLNKILSLYLFYKRIQEKSNLNNNINYEECYLIDKEFLINIKNEINYKLIKDELENINLSHNILDKDNNQNKYALIINLNDTILKEYSNRKIDKKQFKNKMIEPNIIVIKENIMVYNNFGIIDKNVLQRFIGKYENNKILAKYIINNGHIIIYLPNYLNEKKYVSLIGSLDYEQNISIEYFFIFDNENDMKIYIEGILNQLDNYMNNINLINNISPIFDNNSKIIGNIIKYENNNNNNYNNDNQIKDLKNEFKECPKFGLQNIGATCYMNATLQCFCHIKKFVEFFKYSKQVIDFKNNEKLLSYSFKILIDNLWPNENIISNNKYYVPEDFKNKISIMNPLFNGVAANDSKDLVNFIIMTLHLELNKIDNNQNDNYIAIDQTNKELVLNNYIQEFIKSNKSIISDLFYATNCNITECWRCHIKIYNYQVYFFITFPLEEVRKYKNQFNQYNNNIVNIYDCFDYDSKSNIMNGDNSMYCNYCKMNCDCVMSTHLVTGPEILILILNRGKGIQFDVKINFVEYLNLSNYIEFKNTGVHYELIGVITHIGESGMGGHFIAYCRDPLSKLWNKYNDAIVTDVNNFQNDVINFAMPYLLFYQKINI